MEQESIYKNIAVIGLGAAGGFFSVLASKNPYNIITAFDLNEPFSTLLPTGGGRCNITCDEDDIREFVKNYPRGEKFLLSVFSKMPQNKTRDLFRDLGIKTYTQTDKRVFPVSNSSEKTIKTLKKHLETSNFIHKKEKVLSLAPKENYFELKTKEGLYKFENVIIATGGKGMELLKTTGHNIIEPKPSLTALDIIEKEFYSLAGVSFKNAEINAHFKNHKYYAQGDLLFTHKSISAPCVFKISSLSAYDDFSSENPMEITLKLTDYTFLDFENEIKTNSKKSIKNLFSKFAPESFINCILKLNNIDGAKQTAQLKKTEKEILYKSLSELKLHVQGRIKNSEIVTAGGIDLNETDSKTMQSKLIPHLYFIGEVLNIDGFTGGFNLQNCWSTAYICSLNFNN